LGSSSLTKTSLLSFSQLNQNPSVSDIDASTDGHDAKFNDKAGTTVYSNQKSEMQIDENL